MPSAESKLAATLNEERMQRSVLRRIRLVRNLSRSRSQDAVESLSMILETDPDDDVRGLAAIALGRMRDPSGACALRKTLDDPTLLGQISAILGVGSLRDRGSVPRLSEHLVQSTSSPIRQFAASVLGHIGDNRAVPVLIGALDDRKAGVQGAAAVSLARIGDQRALEPLRLARQSARGLVRRDIGRALDKLEGRSGHSWWRRVHRRVLSADELITVEMRFMAAIQIASAVSKTMTIRARKQRQLTAAIDRGRRLFSSGREQETLDFLERAVKQFPEDPEIRWLYAVILLAFRPEDVAVQAAKAVALAPDDPSILVRVASLLFNRGEVEEARSCAVRANDLAQPDFIFLPELVNLNGCLAAADGDDDVAEEELRAALESEPSSSPFAVDLAQFLARRDRQADAVSVIDEALAHVKDGDALKRLREEIETDAADA